MVAPPACGRSEFCSPEFRDPRARAKKAKQPKRTSRMIFPWSPSLLENFSSQFGLGNEELPIDRAFLIMQILANKI
jgi:hypothetical protein